MAPWDVPDGGSHAENTNNHTGGSKVGRLAMSLRERFDAKYVVNEFGCWIWTAARSSWGYGFLGVAREGAGMAMRGAHRISWELHRGAIPDGLSVLHRCDVPLCVNPDHLFLGTQKDNLKDMRFKGRGVALEVARGERNAMAKLTESGVLAIREKRAAGATYRELAEQHDTSLSNVASVVTRRTWRHL